MKTSSIIIALLLASSLSLADYECEGTKSMVTAYFSISDIKGDKILVDKWIKMQIPGKKKERILSQKWATLVATDKGFAGDAITGRTYVLPSADNSYATLLYIPISGESMTIARPMFGGADDRDLACKHVKNT